MMEGAGDFVPIYDATLTAILIPQFRIESPAILFNRKQVDLLGLVSEKKEPLITLTNLEKLLDQHGPGW